jgi:hypothetical protein
MEGALPSVIGGLVDRPIIARADQLGYGMNFQVWRRSWPCQLLRPRHHGGQRGTTASGRLRGGADQSRGRKTMNKSGWTASAAPAST